MALCTMIAGCAPAISIDAPAEPEQFVDVANDVGLVFAGTHGEVFRGIGPLGTIMQRNMGNGAAVGDYDNDGDLDVYLLAPLGRSNRLYRNELDTGIKAFTDVTEQARVGDTGMSRIAHFVDFDNDGRLDLLLVNDDDGSDDVSPSRLFHNQGDGTFTDRTAGSGFRPIGLLQCGAAVADYDQDGLLDIYITNWSFEMGSGEPRFPGQNRLYRNRGDFRFEDVTEAAGLPGLSVDSFSPVFARFDDDTFPDLFLAVDHGRDRFFVNQAGTLAEVGGSVGATHGGNDMGVACADFDDDGDLDIYCTNITEPRGLIGTGQFNVLYVNEPDATGQPRFTDRAVERGVQDTYWGWGVEFTDVENDGHLDLVAVGGMDRYVAYTGTPFSPIYNTPGVLFANDGTGHFNRRLGTALDRPRDSRALIAFDYDRDGDEDLLITNINQPVQLLENTAPPTNRWLEVRLEQTTGGNRFAIGATLLATVGSVTKRRDILNGDSFLAGTPAEAHFGLAGAEQVDTLRIRWPDGAETQFDNLRTNQTVKITRTEFEVVLECYTPAGLTPCPP